MHVPRGASRRHVSKVGRSRRRNDHFRSFHNPGFVCSDVFGYFFPRGQKLRTGMGVEHYIQHSERSRSSSSPPPSSGSVPPPPPGGPPGGPCGIPRGPPWDPAPGPKARVLRYCRTILSQFFRDLRHHASKRANRVRVAKTTITISAACAQKSTSGSAWERLEASVWVQHPRLIIVHKNA